MNKLLNVAFALGLGLTSCGKSLTNEDCQKPTRFLGITEYHPYDRVVEGACLDSAFPNLDSMRNQCRGDVSKLYLAAKTKWVCDKKCNPEDDYAYAKFHEPGWNSCDDAEER